MNVDVHLSVLGSRTVIFKVYGDKTGAGNLKTG